MFSIARPLRTHLAIAAATALLVGCATGPEIVHDVKPAADFARYRTFGFFSPLATDKAGYESVFTARMKESTRRAMEAKGYVYRDTGGDLLINFFANVQDKQEIRSVPVAYDNDKLCCKVVGTKAYLASMSWCGQRLELRR